MIEEQPWFKGKKNSLGKTQTGTHDIWSRDLAKLRLRLQCSCNTVLLFNA